MNFGLVLRANGLLIFFLSIHLVSCLDCFFGDHIPVPAEDAFPCLYNTNITEGTKRTILDITKNSLDAYVFKDIVRNSPKSYPLRHISVDIDHEIEGVYNETLGKEINAFNFYQIIQDKIFTPLADAHTQFIKPGCLAYVFIQPFTLGAKMVDEKFVIFAKAAQNYPSLGTDEITFWNKEEVSAVIGQEITHIDGLPIIKAIQNFIHRYPMHSKDPSVNFNKAIQIDFMSRQSLMASGKLDRYDMEYTLSNGKRVTFKWAALWSGFNDYMCDNADYTGGASLLPSHETSVTPLKPDSDTLIYRIPSFMSRINEELFLKSWRLTRNFTKLIVDLRGNGGGLVCEGMHLVQHLTSAPPPVYVDVRHSKLVDELVRLSGNTSDQWFGTGAWPDPKNSSVDYADWYGPRALRRGGKVAEYSEKLMYTGAREKSCVQSPNPWRSQGNFEQILLLTDGNCGSTCAIFTTLMSKQHEHVKTVTTGGLPHQKHMSFSTFPGGLSSLSDCADGGRLRCELDDFAFDRVEPQSKRNFCTDSDADFSEFRADTVRGQELPDEFTFYPADHRLMMWPGVNDDEDRELYERVDALFT
ncbi:hypothetical protein PROFUN_07256 [Planoprotostelium fungivorum]|uniref:Tail specific protease domain-containing protein n=1 Tax=Planoprotostelium fungivorum TaxID=1890364 RepID=A0A2P6NMC9_9EUKA|nr:hypothetical protein PROFUN_07256 [Planoprotostelium fungivorum]